MSPSEPSQQLFVVCVHGVTILSIHDGLTIQHGSAVRHFSWLELEGANAEEHPVHTWFDQLHQKEAQA